MSEYTKQELLDLLNNASREFQVKYPGSARPILRSWWRNNGYPSDAIITKLFGSWSNFVANASFHMDIAQDHESNLNPEERDASGIEKRLLVEVESLFKSKQKAADKLSAFRKIARETVRSTNATETLTEGLIEAIHEYKPPTAKQAKKKVKKNPNVSVENGVGIIQLSDLHFNERIITLGNEYNWEIASARLKVLIDEAIELFLFKGVTKVLVAFCGDLVNSDARMDQLLANSTNRTKAIFLAFEILRQMIEELSQYFIVHISAVSGNESRVGKEIGFSQITASENYDFAILNILYVHFEAKQEKLPEEKRKVIFHMNDDPTEHLVTVAGQDILLLHGHTLFGKAGGSGYDQKIQSIIGKYATQGYNIRFILFGHIHCAINSDLYARSSSLSGTNDYASKGLHLTGRASQNLHIVHPSDRVDSIKVDLQHYDLNHRYPFDPVFASYNSHAEGKLIGKDKKERFSIVI